MSLKILMVLLVQLMRLVFTNTGIYKQLPITFQDNSNIIRYVATAF
jgi:hypothetical protein